MKWLMLLVALVEVRGQEVDPVTAGKLSVLEEINLLKGNSGPPRPSTVFVTSRRGGWRRELVVDDTEGESSVSVVTGRGSEEEDPQATFKPFSQEELNHYLSKFKESQGARPKGADEGPNRLETEPTKGQDKSKSWHLVQSQSHNHPYDDRQGWVTLEPVPWSQSQVQKWEPNQPSKPTWDDPPPYRPSKPDRPHSKPSYDYGRPQEHRPSRPHDRPTTEYRPDRPERPNRPDRPDHRPSHWDNEPQNSYSKPQWQQIWNSQSDIITDNRPSKFPEPNKWYDGPRPHTEVVYHGAKDTPTREPEGDGHWVLLSSTKGYSYPNRKGYQRALGGSSVSSRRTVRLTVLPGDGANTTTSHGGLLEVERSSQTVEESQREHAARALRQASPPAPTLTPVLAPLLSPASRRSTRVTVLPVERDPARSNAVLAAVGAGMIPATMAMLLPMVVGRKKREASYLPTPLSLSPPYFAHFDQQ